MLKKISLIVLVLVAYLAASYLLQPKLREVLRVPGTDGSLRSEIRDQRSENGGQETENPDYLSYNCQENETVYGLLLKNTDGRVETKDYSFGKLVNSIQGLKGGTEGKYWLYFVDGKSATLSADSYHCQDKEKVEWKFTAEH